MNNREFVHLSGGDCSVVIALDTPVPRLVHWGAEVSRRGARDLVVTDQSGIAVEAPDIQRTPSVVPTGHDAWIGISGFEGHRGGQALPLALRLADAEHDSRHARLRLADDVLHIAVELTYALDDHGVLSCFAALENTSSGGDPVDVAALRVLLPIPARASEVLNFSGRWSRERTPQRRPLAFGTHEWRANRGRTGHDSPFLVAAGTAGFRFGEGELWGVHLAWSGAAEYAVERMPEGAGSAGAMLGAAEALAAGEIRLAPGTRYETPAVVFVWSDAGLDGATRRLHGHMRDFDAHPSTPRPITVNSWEALYFAHDMQAVGELVERAARIGAERFVLDDGWFRRRDDDTSSLGDWFIDESKWPEGLAPLSRLVRGNGMQFGLWFEPEMVNPDSDLAREHPEWLLAPLDRDTSDSRSQQTLNVAHPDAFQYLHERISSLVAEIGIDYIKWDHNRDITEAVDRSTGRPGVHRQTRAAYALMDAVRRDHPGLEIESCAGGGGRVDLGILRRTQRIWASDTLDPLERQLIQLWTATVVPPELMGTHVGAERAHTTGRSTDLPFRLATALFGHSGIEWDLTECSDAELERLAAWASVVKRIRPLIARGDLVRVDVDDPQTPLYAMIDRDRAHAIVWWARLGTSTAVQSGRIPLRGLRPDADYRVRICTELGEPQYSDRQPIGWLEAARHGDLVLSGEALCLGGLPWPTLHPSQALVLELSIVE